MTDAFRTVRDMIHEAFDGLTVSERKLAASLLENYPVAGLASITIVAENAGVSTPTVARMVQKLGFKGYPQFHKALRDELEATLSGPVKKREVWAAAAPESHMLNRFSEAVMVNLGQTFSNLNTDAFDAAVAEMANAKGHLYVVGGRVTRALAEYAFTHFQAIRENVTHMTSSAATWPHYVLDMGPGDVILMLDIRRYETNLMRLAELATERGVKVVLITDQWASPVSKVAPFVFPCWVQVPSAWDSNIATMLLLEAMIAAVQEEDWPRTSKRYEALEELHKLTRIFRKPS